MSTKITDTEMTSDETPHAATAWPVPGEPTLWSVTWLPGRALTRNQAITAMTIAEYLAARDNTSDWRLRAGSWAAELGLTADEAATMTAAPPAHSPGESQAVGMHSTSPRPIPGPRTSEPPGRTSRQNGPPAEEPATP